MTVEVPNVVGKRLAGARRAIETTGLQFVSFDGYRTDDAGNRARVTAQLPRAGAIVSRGSCMGLRAR
jgi:beta-lactam-binding protein with PASTA domain